MIKVNIKNFQAIEEGSLEIEGFTVLRGPNNSGKSAVVRAIRGALQNTGGSSYIRHGATQATVDIDWTDGQWLTWNKGAKPSYICSGHADPIFPGRAIPEEVEQQGVHSIDITGEKIWPQIGAQRKTTFLLDQPGSMLAEAVSDVSRVSQINKALKATESEKRSNAAELKVRQNDVLKLETTLKDYTGFAEVEAEVQALEEKDVYLQKLQTAIPNIKKLSANIKEASSRVSQLSPVRAVSIPVADDLKKLNTEIEICSKLNASLKAVKTRSQKLQGVENTEIPESSKLLLISQKIQEIKELAKQRSLAEQKVKRLNGVKELALPEKPADNTTEFRILTQKIKNKSQELQNIQGNLSTAEKEFEDAEAELKKELGELKVCPVCQSTICQH